MCIYDIIVRKQNNIDCTESESAQIKEWIRSMSSIVLTDKNLFSVIQDLFPLECSEVDITTIKKDDGFYDFEAPLLLLHNKCYEAIEALMPNGIIIDCHRTDNAPTINTRHGAVTVKKLYKKDGVVYVDVSYEVDIIGLLLNDLIALYEYLHNFITELKRELNK